MKSLWREVVRCIFEREDAKRSVANLSWTGFCHVSFYVLVVIVLQCPHACPAMSTLKACQIKVL